nr:hypothetical protein [Pseudarthrobacter sulfonivorans]
MAPWLTGVCAGVRQGPAGLGELIDGVQLPREVVEPDAATHRRRRGGAYAEEAEVVVVAGAGQPQECSVRSRFAGDHFHAEDVGVEALGPVKVGDE